jgi:hypothetical protein
MRAVGHRLSISRFMRAKISNNQRRTGAWQTLAQQRLRRYNRRPSVADESTTTRHGCRERPKRARSKVLRRSYGLIHLRLVTEASAEARIVAADQSSFPMR